MKNITGILFLFFALLSCGMCFGVEEKTTIKVGISNSAFSTYEHTDVEFFLPSYSSIINMKDDSKKLDVAPNSTVQIKFSEENFQIYINGNLEVENVKGPVVITSGDKIGINNLKRKGTPAYYRGMIELKPLRNGKFNIINTLDMQTYLKGVVPNEMPVSFGFEALKAQAVAARNYANRPNAAYQNYDVCDSTACQVYYGANSQTSLSDRAVDETMGIYALYDNEIILALYSSTPSGITENYFETFGDFIEDKPYLKSVYDSEDLRKMSEKEYFKTSPPSFDMKSPKYRWERKFEKKELEEILSKTLVEQSKSGNVFPKYNGEEEFSNLKDIKVLKRGASNKALEIEIKSSSGNYIVRKELPIRRLFKQNGQILPSANFLVDRDFEKVKKEKKKESEAIFKYEEENTESESAGEEGKAHSFNLFSKPASFTFYGAGFGHGVGMSQYGAGFLSSYGVSYENILKHYYTGITLGTVPKTVSYNEGGIDYVQNFYFSKKSPKGKFENPNKSPLKKELNALLKKDKKPECFLVIENNNKVSNVEFYINDYYFNPEFKGFKKKILKTDITKYLNDGSNKVTFKPLNEGDRKKSLRFYITLGEEDE